MYNVRHILLFLWKSVQQFPVLLLTDTKKWNANRKRASWGILFSWEQDVKAFGPVYNKIEFSIRKLVYRHNDVTWAVDSLHKRPVTQKMFPFDDVTIGNLVPYCSLVKIIGESPHPWPGIGFHGNPYTVLYISITNTFKIPQLCTKLSVNMLYINKKIRG